MKLTVLGRVGRGDQVGEAGNLGMRIFTHGNIVILLSLAVDVRRASFSLCHPRKTRRKDGVDPERSWVEDLLYRYEVRWWEWTK